MPLISIVIPVYNATQTIERTLLSVKRQTYPHYEIIIVNDGSDDSSLVIVEQFKKDNSDVEIIVVNKINGGVSTARNAGMKLARGKYIALLDADDEWLPDKLERQVKILTDNTRIDFLGSTRNGEKHKRFFFKRFSYLTHISSRLLLYKTFFVTPTVIFKRSILEKVGYFDESQRYAEEGNYWIRVCQDNYCVLQNESLVLTGAGKPHFGFSGLSSNLLEMEKGELKNIRDALDLNIIGRLEYFILVSYSLLKYLRRLIIVKIRKINTT